MHPLFGIFNLGTQEVLLLLFLGVVFFGRKLPEIGRYMGVGIKEFNNGLRGFEEQLDDVALTQDKSYSESARLPQRVAASAPKFEANGSTPSHPTNA